jgi:hypothetical protein
LRRATIAILKKLEAAGEIGELFVVEIGNVF